MDRLEIIFSLIGAIAIILGGVWFIVQRAFNSGVDKQRLNHLESSHRELLTNVSELPCTKHKEEIQKFDLKYDELQRLITSTNDLVTEINKWIIKSDAEMVDKLVRKASPLKMTPLGEVLFIKSGAKDTMVNNIDNLIKELEEINPKTAYDVENESLNILLKNIGNPIFDKVKQYLYYSPEKVTLEDPEDGKLKELPVSIHHIAKLMSVYLRDEYLRKHTNIV